MVDLSTLDAEDISNLTDGQEIVLSLVPLVSSLLSCLGSASIVYMVLRQWREKQSAYRRILLGMSICDLGSSMVYPFQSFLVPKDTSQRVWAVGTDATCSGLGFLQQVAFSNVWYNAMLSVYFLLTVRFGVRQEVLARRYEPWFHVLSIGYPLSTATLGAVMGVFHEVKVGNGCWVTNYPEGCGCNELDDGVCCTSPRIAWVFAGIPNMLAFCVILFNNLLVYLHVRFTIRRSLLLQASSIDPSSTLTGMRRPTVAVNPGPRSSRAMFFRSSRTSAATSSARTSRTDPQVKRIRAVATQAFLYVLAFLLVYTPSMCLRIMESKNYDAEDEQSLFPLLVLQAIFLPLAGFFNCAIYVRPSYMRTRKGFPDETKLWAVRRALYGPTVRPTMGDSTHMDRSGSTTYKGGTIGRILRSSSSQPKSRSAKSSTNSSSKPHSSTAPESTQLEEHHDTEDHHDDPTDFEDELPDVTNEANQRHPDAIEEEVEEEHDVDTQPHPFDE